ncbi:DUF4173 domain-containing protein [Stieleria sp. TO1_6]|uniref:DUF4153 domain-containing protein n=1 Tax=Stieleria tagensis TaxID=2956795 RepID=UPI00209ACE38|nr:DUF4153 domain-containing protein [Stieleria tagensis]MCO8123192.1 DUF4173 domain-containing protein [Stieleria tagensis]
MNDSQSDGEQPTKYRAQMSRFVAVGLLLWTILADWLIYRTHGYAGPAVFSALMPLFFLCKRGGGSPQGDAAAIVSDRRWMGTAKWVCAILLIATSIRLAFNGNLFVVWSAMLMTFALALVASGVFPWALETIAMSVRCFLDGLAWIYRHRLPTLGRSRINDAGGVPMSTTLTWLMPVLASVVFGGIFVLANPNLIDLVSNQWNRLATWTWQWASRLDAIEIPFCVFALIVGAGLLFPHLGRKRIGGTDPEFRSQPSVHSLLYAASRNTLVCLVVLFTVYLVFEFKTLWKHEFPTGFYYAGYAHQGAAWLTAALALATGLLSLIFRGSMLHDPRLGRLKWLAWCWSATNFLLAVAVFNRLAIYVGYNGLTAMRLVGFFGISVVVIGFVLVLVKIAWHKGFWWLMRTQLTALLMCVIAFTLFPVDWVTHRYNVFQVNQGYLPPAVMIAVKPSDDSGYLPMIEVVDHPDDIIREGVRAMLAHRQLSIEERTGASPWHWTRYQAATAMLYRRMAQHESSWQIYRDNPDARVEAINRFESYAMQWY